MLRSQGHVDLFPRSLLRNRRELTTRRHVRGDSITREGEIVVRQIVGWTGEEQRTTSMGTIVEEISARALGIGAHVVLGDQREEASLSVLYAQQGVQFKSYAWSEPSKDEAVQWL